MRITESRLRRIVREELGNLKESQPQAERKPLSYNFYAAKPSGGFPQLSVDELEGAELPSMPLSKIDLTYDESDVAESESDYDDYTNFDERVENALKQTQSKELKGLVMVHGQRVPYTLYISRYVYDKPGINTREIAPGKYVEYRYSALLGGKYNDLSLEDYHEPHFALQDVIERSRMIPKDVVGPYDPSVERDWFKK